MIRGCNRYIITWREIHFRHSLMLREQTSDVQSANLSVPTRLVFSSRDKIDNNSLTTVVWFKVEETTLNELLPVFASIISLLLLSIPMSITSLARWFSWFFFELPHSSCDVLQSRNRNIQLKICPSFDSSLDSKASSETEWQSETTKKTISERAKK